MPRIAVVDDQPDMRQQLCSMIDQYSRENNCMLEVTAFSDGAQVITNYCKGFDIIFLDVEMKHLDGMETARRIRERDGGVLIVFITNMADFPLVNAEYSKVFAENPPARSCVAVKELPLGGLVEIEVLAVV